VSRPESYLARNRLTPVAAVVGAVIGVVALTGCGAGQITQTSDQVAAVAGANATVGTIAIRNAQIEFDTAAHGAAIYPAGASAPLQAVIVNTGAEPDRLVAASSPVASAVEISGETEVPGGQALVVDGVPAQQTVTQTPAPTSTDTAAVPTPAAPTPAAPTPAAPTPSATATPGEPRSARIVLTGLREDIEAGPNYPVVLTFERAGDVRVDVPVGNPDTPRLDQH
jgi:copper(I)-binding protein